MPAFFTVFSLCPTTVNTVHTALDRVVEVAERACREPIRARRSNPHRRTTEHLRAAARHGTSADMPTPISTDPMGPKGEMGVRIERMMDNSNYSGALATASIRGVRLPFQVGASLVRRSTGRAAIRSDAREPDKRSVHPRQCRAVAALPTRDAALA